MMMNLMQRNTLDWFEGTIGKYDRINTQPEVRLRVGAFDVGVLVLSSAAIFLVSVHGKCLRYTEDVGVVVNFGTWTMNQNAL